MTAAAASPSFLTFGKTEVVFIADTMKKVLLRPLEMRRLQ